MTIEKLAPVLQQLAAKEPIDRTDLYIERNEASKARMG